MVSGPYEEREQFPTQLKILIAGGFGVGKTTFVGSVSEIPPLTTEEHLTAVSAGTDKLVGVESKTTTTVAMDFGRVTLQGNIKLYMFGTPGQDRFWFMWDELCRGTLGAVVLADTRRLADCFPTIEFFESRNIGFLVALNEFDGAFRYDTEEVRAALHLHPFVPIMHCDARSFDSAKSVLVSLLDFVIKRTRAEAATGDDPITTVRSM